MKTKLPRNYFVHNDQLHFKKINLLDLTKVHGSPLRIHAPELLSENYTFLKELVGQQLTQKGINASAFSCGYAMKANQHYRLVSEAGEHVDFLEASSYNDLCLLEQVLASQKSKKILCHGFKLPDTVYFKKIINLLESGYTIIPIIDSIDELCGFNELNIKLDVGIRITSAIEHAKKVTNERFGVTFAELQKHSETLLKSSQLNLTTVHMHVANTIVDIDKRIRDLKNIFLSYEYLQKKKFSIEYINIGGGLPSRAYTDDSFYTTYYRRILEEILAVHPDRATFPILQTESGRFLSEESQFLMLKVLTEKNTNTDFSWYVLNGSAINLIPEAHLDESKVFSIIPTDGLDSDTPNKRVLCAGTTCDPEDYFSKNTLLLPEYSAFSHNIVIPNTGAYQESLQSAARNQPGHCLVEAPKELTLNTNGVQVHKPNYNLFNLLGYNS